MLASAWPLSHRFASGQGVVVPLLLVGALAGWYAYWRIVRTAPAGPALYGYLAGAGALWLALLAVDGSFLFVGLNVLAPYCLHSLRIGLVVVSLSVGGWLWQRAAAGSVSWQELVIAALIAVSGTATAGYFSSMARTSAERKRLIDQLRAVQDARGAAERQAGVAAERQRLARDIHDTVTQDLASIVMLLEAADASRSSPDRVDRHITQALRAARDSLAESRRVVWALRPAELGDDELPGALGRLAARLCEETGVRAETVVTGAPRPVSPQTQLTVLRVAQEALSNVRRHARASHVTLTVSYLDDLVALDVQDDGVGIDPGRVAAPGERLTGVGLKTMRERVEELGGTFVVESTPGEGVTIAATLPLQAPVGGAAAQHDPATRATPGER